jgi:D-3-phosphoglycerate dehydrogenase
MDSKWNVLITRPVDEEGLQILDDVAEISWVSDYGSWDDCKEVIDTFDAIIHRSVEIDAYVIKNATNLKIITKQGEGLDQIVVVAATEQKVLVCNTPGANSRAVAEHSITLMAAVRKSVVAADKDLRSGEWDRYKYAAHEFESDTLGLFGCGSVGRIVADLVRGLDLQIIAYDPYVDEATLPNHIELVENQSDLFERSDIVSVHSPLTDETYHTISTEEFQALPESSIVVNTARGPIIDEDALVNALETDEIAGAGIDVFENEPPDADNPLLSLDDVVVTPHIAGTTHESAYAKITGAARNIRTFYNGEIPTNAVNSEAILLESMFG